MSWPARTSATPSVTSWTRRGREACLHMISAHLRLGGRVYLDDCRRVGERRTLRNWQRWSSPALDKIIEEIRTVGFDDPRSIELGKEYVKLAVKEMPTIPLMAYNVFTAMDQTYWTGFPTAENPYTNPVPNWGNSRYMFVRLKPAN